MRETLTLLVSSLFGVLLGVLFFGGLWWTVRKGLASSRPEVWFLGSLLLRTAVVLSGFYAVTPGGLKPMMFCLLGFVVAKIAVAVLSKPPLVPERTHAH